MKAPDTPTLDRIAANRGESKAIGDFLDWLKRTAPEASVVSLDIQKLLADYFGIDRAAEERERRALLAHEIDRHARRRRD